MRSLVFLKTVAMAVVMPLLTVAVTPSPQMMNDKTPINGPTPSFALEGFDHLGKSTAKPVVEGLENGHLRVNVRFTPSQMSSGGYCALFQSTDGNVVGMLDEPFPVHNGAEARSSAELLTASELKTVGVSIERSGYKVFAMCADNNPLRPFYFSKFYAVRATT
jgi:hypothetical protein